MKPAWRTKDFPFELKDLDEEAGTFTGYAAVFGNVDLDGDVIEPGAFRKTIRESGGKVPILWQHDRYEPIGVGKLAEDGKGLLAEGQLNVETQRGREARALMQQGALSGLSIGYKAIKPVYEAGVRRLKEIAVREFSPVTFPANELARVATVKGMGSLLRDLRLLRETDEEGFKALLAELEPDESPLEDDGAAGLGVEPEVTTRLRELHTRMQEVIR
jgi:hypothetical protein